MKKKPLIWPQNMGQTIRPVKVPWQTKQKQVAYELGKIEGIKIGEENIKRTQKIRSDAHYQENARALNSICQAGSNVIQAMQQALNILNGFPPN